MSGEHDQEIAALIERAKDAKSEVLDTVGRAVEQGACLPQPILLAYQNYENANDAFLKAMGERT